MNELTFVCPHCSKSIGCGGIHSGDKIDCPACGNLLSVPPRSEWWRRASKEEVIQPSGGEPIQARNTETPKRSNIKWWLVATLITAIFAIVGGILIASSAAAGPEGGVIVLAFISPLFYVGLAGCVVACIATIISGIKREKYFAVGLVATICLLLSFNFVRKTHFEATHAYANSVTNYKNEIEMKLIKAASANGYRLNDQSVHTNAIIEPNADDIRSDDMMANASVDFVYKDWNGIGLINAAVTNSFAPLHLAVMGGRAEIAGELLMNGADVNVRTKTGRTPLMYATGGGNKDLVHRLLANGADANLKDNTGKTALDFAREGHWTEVVAMLDGLSNKMNFVDAGFLHRSSQDQLTKIAMNLLNPHDVRQAAMSQWIWIESNRASVAAKTRKYVLDQFPELMTDLYRYNQLTRSELEAAADDPTIPEKDRQTFKEALAKTGYNAYQQSWNAEQSDKEGNKADTNNYLVQVNNYYTEHPEMINMADTNSFTPLHLAVIGDRADVTTALLKHGANINARTTNGRSPLMYAAGGGRKAEVEILLANGADASLKDEAGKTALDFAREGHWTEVVAMLQNALNKAQEAEVRPYMEILRANPSLITSDAYWNSQTNQNNQYRNDVVTGLSELLRDKSFQVTPEMKDYILKGKTRVPQYKGKGTTREANRLLQRMDNDELIDVVEKADYSPAIRTTALYYLRTRNVGKPLLPDEFRKYVLEQFTSNILNDSYTNTITFTRSDLAAAVVDPKIGEADRSRFKEWLDLGYGTEDQAAQANENPQVQTPAK